EELPFESNHFDAVTGFNSFQFAGDIPRAIAEAARVCRPGGTVTMCVWGPPGECEAFSGTIMPMMALVPPPPPTGRPPLSNPGVVEGLLSDAGLQVVAHEGADVPFEFRDAATAWRCFASAGLTELVIRQAGEEAVRNAAMNSFKPFTRAD